MKLFTKFLLFFAVMALNYQVQAQERYLDEVFDDVEVVYGTYQTAFGANYTILPFIASEGQAHMTFQPLIADMYYPKGDTETNRPLILYVHTGNFFPYPANGSCGGTLQDSSNVEIATRLAKRGFVVAVVDYRLGWNPFADEELVRRFFLINAAYRGVQDMTTYARYFRRSVAEFGNPHGVDPEKITIWGQGTGGYLSLISSYLKSYPEVFETDNPGKFIIGPPVAPFEVPMVIEQYNGTLTTEGPITTVDATYNAFTQLPIGDTLCIPNHVGYNSDFALCVNAGGAIGDSSWLDKGEIPLISFHVDTDPNAPVDTDVLNVPTALGPQPVVEVTGSRDLARRVERFGNNDIFNTIPAQYDPYGPYNPSGFNGYYEFRNTPNDESAPWEWTASNNPVSGAICNQDGVSARTYIDTLVGYFIPRACVALKLDCFSSSTDEIKDAQVDLRLSPNPASHAVNISVSEDTPIRSLAIYDMSGRMVRNNEVNATSYTIKRDNLQDGMYIVRMQFEKGILNKKVIFN